MIATRSALSLLASTAFLLALGCAKTGGDAAGDAAAADASVGNGEDAGNPADGASAPDASPRAQDAAPSDSGATGDASASGNACEALGGLCLGQGAACTNGGGTVSVPGAAGCLFSDGPGVCCLPPAPQASGADCRAHGGLCAPIAGCNFTHGNFAPPSCGGVGIVCCVPQKICGEETVACCNDTTTFRPACDRGQFVCTIAGTTRKPRGQCP